MSYMVNPYVFGGVTELERNAVWYETQNNNTTITSDARPIGTASATRRVFALITINFGIIDPGPGTLNSVTIGGISATIHVVVNEGDDILNAIASAVVPTGTTAVVVASFSHPADDVRIGCIALDHPLGIAIHDTVGEQAEEPLAGTIDYPNNGYGMFLARRGSFVNQMPAVNWIGAEGYYFEYFENEDDGDIFRDPTAAAYVLKQSGNGVSIQAAWGSQADNVLVGLTAGPAS